MGRRAALAPLATGAVYLVSALLVLGPTRGADGIAAIWPSNALLVAALLRVGAGRHGPYLIAGGVASLAANLLAGMTPTAALGFSLANVIECAVVVALLARLGPGTALFSSLSQIGGFALAVFAAAALSATVATVTTVGLSDGRQAWLSWFTTDTLGLLVIVPPALVALALVAGDPGVAVRRPRAEVAVLLLMLVAANLLTFAQQGYPLLFLPLAALIFATARLGPLGATVALLVTAVAGSLGTALGYGPLAQMRGHGTAVLFFQVYLVVTFAASLPLASLLASERSLLAHAERGERFYRSMIERSHALIFETDREGRWSFLSSAWQELTGTPPAAALGRSIREDFHPEDGLEIEAAMGALAAGSGPDARLDARYRGPDGGWRWATLRLMAMRDEAGELAGFYGVIMDVHGRVEAEEGRARADQLYRLLADHSSDMIVRLDLAGVRHYISPACQGILGRSPAMLVGSRAVDCAHPEDRAQLDRITERLLAGEQDPIAIYRERAADGRYVWLEASFRLVRDAATGRPVEIVSTVRDVSRRQAAELELVASAARLRESHRLLSLTETVAAIGHWRFDLTDATLYWSPEVYRLHGRDPAGPSPTLEEGTAAYHPDDRERVLTAIGDGRRSGREFGYEARIVRPDGEIRHVVVRGRPDDGLPGGSALFGIIRDVTQQAQTEAALRESEARYRLLAEFASDVIFRLDADLRYIYVSPSIEALTGQSPATLIGQCVLDYVEDDERERIREAGEGMISGRVERQTVEYRRRTATGWCWMEANTRRGQAGPDGRYEIFGMSRDVTARKQVEADLTAARAFAEQAAREARAIAATDELTGLASRRRFMTRLATEVANAQLTVSPLSIAILDVDHFKQVNDRHGHAIGDAVLQEIAATALRVVRGDDLIGRIGGEEFAVLMPGTDSAAAAIVAERLRAAVEASGTDMPGLPPITISIGAASHTPGQGPSQLLAAADKALYAAKKGGRNRLCMAA